MIPIACIDVGSGALRMEIAETDGTQTRILDSLRLPSMLGRDVYAMGRVSYETLSATCEVLSGFSSLLTEYGILPEQYRVVATSAIREAENRDYVVDQIYIKTGLRANIITNAEERFTIYNCLWNAVPVYREMREEGLVIVDIGYGSIQITTLQKGAMMFSRNIKLGALRLCELLASVASTSLKFSDMLAEYIAASTDHLKALEHWKEFPNCIVLSGEADVLSVLCEKQRTHAQAAYPSSEINGIGGVTGTPALRAEVKDFRIAKDEFTMVFDMLKHMTLAEVQRIVGVDRMRAEMLLPTMLVVTALSDMTSADAIHMPNLALGDGVLIEITKALFPEARHEDGEADIVSLVRELGAAYKYDKSHAENVERIALMLFDSLEELHGLGGRERLLLRLASILHDSGKYISSISHGHRSADIVLSSELMGLSRNELRILAVICRFHSGRAPTLEKDDFIGLHHDNRVISAKLIALLRIADAIDKSHTSRVRLVKVTMGDEEVTLNIECETDPLLEKWMFDIKSEFFKEVFGMDAVLKVKVL